MTGTRARITIPDLVYILMSFAALAALYPVYSDFYDSHVGSMGPGAAWLWQLFLPMAILVIFSVIWLKATQGVA